MHAARGARSEAAAAAVGGREVMHKRRVRTAQSPVNAAGIQRQVEESQRMLRAAPNASMCDCTAADADCQVCLNASMCSCPKPTRPCVDESARSAQPDAQRIAQRNLATSQRAMARSRTPVLGTLEQELIIPAAVPSAAGKVSSCIDLNT